MNFHATFRVTFFKKLENKLPSTSQLCTTLCSYIVHSLFDVELLENLCLLNFYINIFLNGVMHFIRTSLL